MKKTYIAPELEIVNFVSLQRLAYIPDFDLDDVINGDKLVSAGNGVGDPRDAEAPNVQ